MLTIDPYEFTNSELEEMGIPLQCECVSTYRECDDHGNIYDVCVDCNAHAPVGRRAGAW